MCHPGRPRPQSGEGQLGSPGLAAFQRAKSAGERFLLGEASAGAAAGAEAAAAAGPPSPSPGAPAAAASGRRRP